ncbi:hypothetical protein K8089_15970, partial [Aequorivita sp. F47161]
SKALEKQNCACWFYFSDVKKFQLLPFFRFVFLSEKNHCPRSTFVRTAFHFLNTKFKKKSDAFSPIFRCDLGLV